MFTRSLACSVSAVALVLVLCTLVEAGPPPTVTITGKVFENNAVAATGTRVTFRTVGVQTILSNTDQWTITPSTFTASVNSSGDMTSITVPRKLVMEIQVGKSQPRTIYTPDSSTADLSSLLATYNPEIPLGQVITSGGAAETWFSFVTETQIAAGSTVYVAATGTTSTSYAEVVTPAGSASWSDLSCVLGGTTTMTATASLLAGACGSEPASSLSVSNVGSGSVAVGTGGPSVTTAAQCVSLKVVTSGTGNSSFVNCAVKRTAL